MSKPRENARCKLSVLADALWDLTPLPPLHHVVNVDKSSKITVNRFVSRPGRHKTSAEIELTKLMAAEIENTPRTTTYPIDFWPNRHTTGPHSVEPFPRSPYLGLLLEPKETTVLLPEQKDAWDYVLRKCFVRESLPLRDSVQTLGFGADNLIPRFESTTDEFRGRPVDCAMVVRDLEVLDWARIVDVLHKWAFKPAVS